MKLLLLLLPIITQPPRAHTKQLLVTSPINLRIAITRRQSRASFSAAAALTHMQGPMMQWCMTLDLSNKSLKKLGVRLGGAGAL